MYFLQIRNDHKSCTFLQSISTMRFLSIPHEKIIIFGNRSQKNCDIFRFDIQKLRYTLIGHGKKILIFIDQLGKNPFNFSQSVQKKITVFVIL